MTRAPAAGAIGDANQPMEEETGMATDNFHIQRELQNAVRYIDECRYNDPQTGQALTLAYNALLQYASSLEERISALESRAHRGKAEP